jgi:hypothetical protein
MLCREPLFPINCEEASGRQSAVGDFTLEKYGGPDILVRLKDEKRHVKTK